jgi:hypothetical protein
MGIRDREHQLAVRFADEAQPVGHPSQSRPVFGYSDVGAAVAWLMSGWRLVSARPRDFVSNLQAIP